MLYPHGMGMGRQVLSLVDGHEREGVTPFPHRCVAGEILNTFQNPLSFHFMVLEEKPFSKGECTHPKKE